MRGTHVKPSRYTEYCRVEVIGRAMVQLTGKPMSERHIRILSREVLATIDERGRADNREVVVTRAIEEFGEILGVQNGIPRRGKNNKKF
jgi:hypothetical protein